MAIPMIGRLFAGCVLMAGCVTIHAAGIAGALRRVRGWSASTQSFWTCLRLFIVLAVWMVLLHLCEIVLWAAAYAKNGAIADMQTAIYFSAVTYTTTGYGDVVLPPPWRLDSSIEALTGILMCGWSTGFFFAVVSRLFDARPGAVRS
ncbi:MAG TPA: potassium channel family protein [Vicinamibacterales bacterium]|nr:potassium channel family protein [Vicinamibacterales bacterium]